MKNNMKAAAAALITESYNLNTADPESITVAIEKLKENDKYIFPLKVCIQYAAVFILTFPSGRKGRFRQSIPPFSDQDSRPQHVLQEIHVRRQQVS